MIRPKHFVQQLHIPMPSGCLLVITTQAQRQRHLRLVHSWMEMRPCPDLRASPGSGNSENFTDDSMNSSTCVACLANPPMFVCEKGHLVLCRACRRKLVFQRLQKLGEAPRSEQDLQSKALNRTVVACPVCRTESRLTPVAKFSEAIYIQIGPDD